MIGSSAALADIRDIGVVSGRFFTDQEEKSRAFVAVIGDDTRINLFPEGSPLGKTIKINGIDFTVIGVQERLGAAFGSQPRQERLHSDHAATIASSVPAPGSRFSRAPNRTPGSPCRSRSI